MKPDSATSLAPFAFDDSLVRVHADEAGNPWFVAKDVCKVLGLGNPRTSITLLDDDERGVHIVDTLGGAQEMATISESGLYSLTFRSRKPEAKRFRKWVTAEVLPTLRKTGGYTVRSIGRSTGDAANASGLQFQYTEEALRLRPAVRQRLWQDAMQAARLDNAGSDAAQEWFNALCAMMVARRSGRDVWDDAAQFMDEHLEAAPGVSTPSGVIYVAFSLWWKRNNKGGVPSRKFLAGVLQTRFASYKSGTMRYRDCRLIPHVDE